MVLIVTAEFSWNRYAEVLASSQRIIDWQRLVDHHLLPAEGVVEGTRWKRAEEVCHIE
jgi:hypothetical protein